MMRELSDSLGHLKQPKTASITDYEALDDQQLVENSKLNHRNDNRAFDALVNRYESRIFRSALRYLGCQMDAEDVTQDVFVKAYWGLPNFRGNASFKTWIYQILRNECMNRFASRKKTQRIEESVSNFVLTNQQSMNDEESALILNDQIQHSLQTLSVQDREIIILRFISDLSLAEIAQTLDVSLSATKMRFYRALQRFEDEYKKNEQPINSM